MSQSPVADRNLPKLADLHKSPQEAYKDDLFLALVNQKPHQTWVKKHPMAKTEYLPIDKVEFMLTSIFQNWRVEVLTVQSLFQSVQVTIRLHLKSPVTGEWTYFDGVGACPIQTDSGKSAADLSAIKNNAVQLAVPAAKSYAIKDAAEHIGTLFGRDLNRKDTLEFTGAYSQSVPPEVQPAYEATISTHAETTSINIGKPPF